MTETAHRRRRTTMVPVTTLEEMPILDASQKAELIASLEQAEADIRAGKGVEYDTGTFRDRLVRIYRANKR